MEFFSKNLEDTNQIAQNVARDLKGGDILALSGDLGSGKTTFAKGVARALGVITEITSPTFVISKVYKLDLDGIKELVHIDSYRFEDISDAESIGLPEIIQRNDVIIIIEWPEKVWALIKDRARLIKFQYLGENERKITL
jgi:tRNA threonylcarbamoyladenosine biosynthesis protein TsaE